MAEFKDVKKGQKVRVSYEGTVSEVRSGHFVVGESYFARHPDDDRTIEILEEAPLEPGYYLVDYPAVSRWPGDQQEWVAYWDGDAWRWTKDGHTTASVPINPRPL